MCGIIAYFGKKQAAPVLFNGLKKLEYRGYDSAGVAVAEGGKIALCKRAGGVDAIKDCLTLNGVSGVGHTRWATHGKPTENNAHPFLFGGFALCHNGIVENDGELKAELLSRGHTFSSDTDSEVVVHLLAEQALPPVAGLRAVVGRLRGSYALAVLEEKTGHILGVRKESPLLVGEGEDGYFLASDAVALYGVRRVAELKEGDICVLSEGGVAVYDERGKEKKLAWKGLEKRRVEVDKGKFAHFMLKEIYDIPSGVARTVRSSVAPFLSCLERAGGKRGLKRVVIVGCGTAYHSALTGARLLSSALALPVETCIASEFDSAYPPNKNTLVIAVSQSGETADTLACVRLSRRRSATVLALTNTPRSAITRLSHATFLTYTGVEIGVAATKTYIGQLAAFYMFAAALKGVKTPYLRTFPRDFQTLLGCMETIRKIAKEATHARVIYFLGRGADYPTALEGSLKLREVTSLVGAGIPTGELKHGTLAVMDERALVIALVTEKRSLSRSVDGIREVSARGAKVVCITPHKDIPADRTLYLPPCAEKYYPLLSAVAVDLIAYCAAVELGLDPDKPRNLAKSVTVK